MNIKGLLSFLTDLKKNNNREWFVANKDLFQQARGATTEMASRLLNEISIFEPEAINLSPSDCTYRIYRDIRFSIDKSPYKTHIGIFINPPSGKKSLRMGYYLHIEPGNCFLAAGNIGYPTRLLTMIRQDIYDNIDEYLGIINKPEFKRYFPIVGEDSLKTSPKGFPSDWEHIDLLRPKTFLVSYRIADKEIMNRNFIMKAAEIFRISKPFNDFINYSVDRFLDRDQ